MLFKWLREARKLDVVEKIDTGFAYGQISFDRLAEFLESKGETCKGDKIAGLYFDFDQKMIIYRLK